MQPQEPRVLVDRTVKPSTMIQVAYVRCAIPAFAPDFRFADVKESTALKLLKSFKERMR
jgi:hypothetical protein